MGLPLVGRLLPSADAAEMAETAFPALVGDPHAGEVVVAALAHLDCAGSVTAAADRLGIHRNTMQSRLRRAGHLGVRFADPEQLLPTHLLLAPLERAITRAGRHAAAVTTAPASFPPNVVPPPSTTTLPPQPLPPLTPPP